MARTEDRFTIRPGDVQILDGQETWTETRQDDADGYAAAATKAAQPAGGDADPKVPPPPDGLPQVPATTGAWPGWDYDLQLASVYTAQVADAFGTAIDEATALLAEWWAGTVAATVAGLVDLVSDLIGRYVGGTLRRLWTEAWHLGSGSARAVARQETPDWGEWTPGDIDAARLVESAEGLQTLLAAHGITTIRAIASTGMPALATEISDAVGNGDSWETLAKRLPQILSVPQRAPMIARTEIARAVSAATLDQYKDHGVSRKEWEVAPDERVCPICLKNEEAGAIPSDSLFPSGDLNPPGHPNCRCALMPAEVHGFDITGAWPVPAVKAEDLNRSLQTLMVRQDEAKGRTVDLDGQETWTETRQDDEGGFAAGGGAAVHRPHDANGAQQGPGGPLDPENAAGGSVGPSAGGSTPRWDGDQPQPRVETVPDDQDDAAAPSDRGVPDRPDREWPNTYMDGWWPRGGIGSGQAGTSSPGGHGPRGRPPGPSGKTQDVGEAARQRIGVDGTAGDAQDVPHEVLGKVGPHGWSHGWHFEGAPSLTDEDRDRGNTILGSFQPHRFASDNEATAYLQDHPTKLTAGQRDAINRYTGDKFYSLNKALRAGDTSDPDVQRIDAALRPAPDDLIVTRHVGADAFGLADSDLGQVEGLTGKKIRDGAYSSTALGSPYAGGLGGVTMHIAVPEGTPMVNAAALSNNPHEREILLGRGLNLAVSKVTANSRYGYDLYATVLGSADA